MEKLKSVKLVALLLFRPTIVASVTYLGLVTLNTVFKSY